MRKVKAFSPTLRLRGDTQRIDVIVPNGETRPKLGTLSPGDDRRAVTIKFVGGSGSSPRQTSLASIERELPRRAQSILTHRLPCEVRDRLDGHSAGREASARIGDDGDTGSQTLIVPKVGER